MSIVHPKALFYSLSPLYTFGENRSPHAQEGLLLEPQCASGFLAGVGVSDLWFQIQAGIYKSVQNSTAAVLIHYCSLDFRLRAGGRRWI